MLAELMSKDTKFTMHSRKDNWTSSITGIVTMATVGRFGVGMNCFNPFIYYDFFSRDLCMHDLLFGSLNVRELFLVQVCLWDAYKF